MKEIVAAYVFALPHHCVPDARLKCMNLVVTCQETDCAAPGTAAAVLSKFLQEEDQKAKLIKEEK